MNVLKSLISNIENYGNCEFFIKDNDYTNVAFKYLLIIDDKNVIHLKKYWCVYAKDLNGVFVNEKIIFQEYMGDYFYDNIADIIVGSITSECFCTHNLFLDNENGKLLSVAVIPLLKYILEDVKFFDYYFFSKSESVYKYLRNKFEQVFEKGDVILNDNPLSLNELIDNFELYSKLSKVQYNELIKTKTADEYDLIIEKLKLSLY